MHYSRSLPRLFGLACMLLLTFAPYGWGQATQPAAAGTLSASEGGAAPSAGEGSRPCVFGTAAAVPTISWQDAGAHVGKDVFLVGKVIRTSRSRTGHVFLNFDGDIHHTTTVFIYRDNVKNFPQPPQQAYRDKLVKVHGFVYQMNGQPNISLASPNHISVLPDESPLPTPSSQPAAGATTRPAGGDTITIGSYNLLNFFDAADDPYTSDETTGPKPQAEVEALAKSIRGLNADVLALVEVENRGLLQQFTDMYLSDMGYEVVEFEGNDMRGIDVAVLSRLPVGPVTSHRHLRFPDTNGRPTHFQRDLLKVHLEASGVGAFDLYIVHLKSKDGKDNGGIEIRLPEARQARAILDQQLKADPEAPFLVVGDFNDTIDSEPLQTLLGSGSTALKTFINDLPANERVTYNRPPYLSMIDFMLASPAMAKRYVPKSYTIVPGSPQTTGSDHNPVVAKFSLK